MDPQNQQPFNPKIPISEVLKQEQTGFTPSAPLNKPLPPYSPISPSHSVPLSGVINTVNNPDGGNLTHEKIIKTFRSDAADAIKNQQASVAKMAIAQDKQRREREEESVPAVKKNFAPVLIVVILLLLGAASIPAVQYYLNLKKQPVTVNGNSTLIPFDQEETIVVKQTNRASLISAIETDNAKEQKLSALKNINVFETTLDANQNNVETKMSAFTFASLIGPNMPGALARSFDSAYMFGSAGITNAPFIIFRTASYDQSFGNMLRYETKMIADLNPILKLDSNVLTEPFTDKVVANKDVRAISTPEGKVIFLYGFLDNSTLLITTNAVTFQDINSRFIAQHFVQ